MSEHYVLLFFVSAFLYFLFGTIRVYTSRDNIRRRFESFEGSLELKVTDYNCFTNNHPHVWGEVSYAENKIALIESPRWDGQSMFPYAGSEFSLKVDEDRKYIYIAKGSNSFNWSSLCHIDDWKKRKVIYY